MSEPVPTEPLPTEPLPTNHGFGRVLVAVYGIFALSATGRSVYQIATKFHEAPLAYVLSALAAAVYIVATVSLARGDATSRKVALVAILVELVGVLVVGTLSLTDSTAFPDAAVWSGYGSGYGFVPLVLPFVGLWWLYRTRGTTPAAARPTGR